MSDNDRLPTAGEKIFARFLVSLLGAALISWSIYAVKFAYEDFSNPHATPFGCLCFVTAVLAVLAAFFGVVCAVFELLEWAFWAMRSGTAEKPEPFDEEFGR